MKYSMILLAAFLFNCSAADTNIDAGQQVNPYCDIETDAGTLGMQCQSQGNEWTWIDAQGNKHSCLDSCEIGSECVLNNVIGVCTGY